MGSTFAERYQNVLTPIIFEPWARELIARCRPRPGDHVLDLACGTGVVTRALAGAGVELASLTAADYSAEMLGVAQRTCDAAGIAVRWEQADAAALPFADGAFDRAYCQQALQFFPDRPAALAELRRVMKPGGAVAFGVQRGLDVNPMLAAQTAALEAHVGAEAGAAVRAICGLPGADTVRALFKGAGFRDIRIEEVTLMLHHPDARAFALGAMGGMHTGDKLSGLENERIAAAADAFAAALGPYLDGAAMRVPHAAHLVTATA